MHPACSAQKWSSQLEGCGNYPVSKQTRQASGRWNWWRSEELHVEQWEKSGPSGEGDACYGVLPSLQLCQCLLSRSPGCQDCLELFHSTSTKKELQLVLSTSKSSWHPLWHFTAGELLKESWTLACYWVYTAIQIEVPCYNTLHSIQLSLFLKNESILKWGFSNVYCSHLHFYQRNSTFSLPLDVSECNTVMNLKCLHLEQNARNYLI